MMNMPERISETLSLMRSCLSGWDRGRVRPGRRRDGKLSYTAWEARGTQESAFFSEEG
jgi:hypothetical protein